MNQVDPNEVRRLAEALAETEAKALADLERVIATLGVARTRELMEEARRLHAAPEASSRANDTGDTSDAASLTTTVDGTRRTLGGVFFQLARPHMPYTEPPPKKRRLRWHEAAEAATEARDAARLAKEPRGGKGTVKITLIGRPGRVIKRDTVVVTTMHNHERPSLPKQLPKLSGADVETRYTIFIAARQWRKVEEAIYADKDDQLIIEGYPFLDPDVSGICVFARSTTTKLLQRAAREAQRAKVEGT